MNIRKKEIYSVQNWLPMESFLKDGIIKLKNNSFIKILKIYPINYHLKSELEKKSILNSYKSFLKTCHFEMQIIIQSNKEDLSKHIEKLKEQNKKEKNQNILNYSNQYTQFINQKNKEKNSSSKNFYILIGSSKNMENQENSIMQDLKDKYFKIKDALARCGNRVEEIKSEKEIQEIYFSFLNVKKYLNKEVL